MSAIDELRHNYQSGHARHVSASLYQDRRGQWPYFRANYHAIEQLPRSARIIEIGPGSGALLAWLRELGFRHIEGIEVAGEEVDALAREGFKIVHGDARDVIAAERAGSLDALVCKAVLEHMTKESAMALIKETVRVLKPGGVVIIDVPNMDWLLSGHERYMDLTHRTGYTKDSLRQLLSLYFDDVSVRAAREPVTSWKSGFRIRLLRPMLVGALRVLFRVLGEGASHVLFDARSVIAVAREPRR